MSTILLHAAAWLSILAGGADELEVREVTQPSLAVSHDGQVLYFGLLGDLVALPATGGEARVLTRGAAYDRSPLPSADGRWLDFLSDRDGAEAVFRLDLESGEVVAIDADAGMHGRTLRMLEDGDRIGVDGRDRQRPLFRTGGSGYAEHYRPLGPERIEWAGIGPNGRFAVLAASGPWHEGRPDGVSVSVVDLEGEAVLAELPAQVFTGERDTLTRAAVSERAAFVPLEGGILRVDLETGEVQELEWSARLTIELPEVALAHNRDRTPPAGTPGARARGIDRIHPAPDGSAVVFAMLGDLWIQTLEGQVVSLTEGPELDRVPEFGPDGEWVYFARGGELARVSASGGEAEIVGPRVATEFFDYFDLSPDATRVAHPVSVVAPGVQTATVGGESWSVHIAGRPGRGSWVTYPSWGARGEELLFTTPRERGALPQVYALATPDDEPRRLTDLERPPRLVTGSHDGRWLAILRDGRAWLAERGEEELGEDAFRALGPVGAHSLSFSSDSEHLWVGSGSDVSVFECDGGREERSFRLETPDRPPRIPPPLVLDGCHVVDVETGEIHRDRRVSVADGRIRAIEPRTAPLDPEAELVDAEGRYLIPGLFDMHVHQVAPLGPSMLAWGVTSVRQLGSVWPAQLTEPELFQRGELLGPRHLSAGEIFEGVPPQWGNAFHLVESVAEAEALVERRARDGVFEIKLYPTLSRELRQAVSAQARASGVRVTSHVATLEEAVTALIDGATCLEHWPEDLPGLHGDLVALLRATGAAWCPTLSVRGAGDLKRRVEGDELDEPLFRATVPDSVLQPWSRRDKVGPMSDENLEWLVLERAAGVVRASEAGVPILVGSDGSLGNALVGPSTHWEMEMLVRGGLEPLDALRSATLVPARYAGFDDLGVVRPGAIADLVLLAENPLEDIRATRTVEGVVFGGRWLAPTPR